MVRMLVRDEDGVQRGGVFVDQRHALHQLAAAEPRVHQHTRLALAITVELPFDPEARTVMRIASKIRWTDVQLWALGCLERDGLQPVRKAHIS